MDHSLFLMKGLIMGLSIAAPIGPVGLLCIRRTLASGPGHGFISGLGAATVHAMYSLLAGFGLAVMTQFLDGWQDTIRLCGGVALILFGLRTLLLTPKSKSRYAQDRSVLGLTSSYGSTILLALTNPVTFFTFAAVFTGVGVVGASDSGMVRATSLLVAGVFLGSAAWWLTLSVGVGLVRQKVTAPVMTWINRVSGLTLIGFGLYIMSKALL